MYWFLLMVLTMRVIHPMNPFRLSKFQIQLPTSTAVRKQFGVRTQ